MIYSDSKAWFWYSVSRIYMYSIEICKYLFCRKMMQFDGNFGVGVCANIGGNSLYSG